MKNRAWSTILLIKIKILNQATSTEYQSTEHNIFINRKIYIYLLIKRLCSVLRAPYSIGKNFNGARSTEHGARSTEHGAQSFLLKEKYIFFF